jgi:predicted Rossmann fold flavoprotein
MGATGFGYEVAQRFGLPVVETRPGLVPLTLSGALHEQASALAGVALEAKVACGRETFEGGLLFTHRGLSGPAVLQISSYWREGRAIVLDLLPGRAPLEILKAARRSDGRQTAAAALSHLLPRRLALSLAEGEATTAALAETSEERLRRLAQRLGAWSFVPAGSEGYRTAEVTVGGVDTRGLDQKTFEARSAPGLFFIGEVVDVTGWLGGYNFQWAWASGWCAGQAV